jgi:hypothetical protein
MAIPDYARANFETLMKAAKAGDLALMECTEVVKRRDPLRPVRGRSR